MTIHPLNIKRTETKTYINSIGHFSKYRVCCIHKFAQVGECKGGPKTNDQCRTFTIYPVFNGTGVQQIHTDRVTEGNENVFMLRMKKKNNSSIDQPRKNIELEVRTPKPPTPPPEKLEKPLFVNEDCVKLVTKEEVPEIEPKQEVKKKKKKKKK